MMNTTNRKMLRQMLFWAGDIEVCTFKHSDGRLRGTMACHNCRYNNGGYCETYSRWCYVVRKDCETVKKYGPRHRKAKAANKRLKQILKLNKLRKKCG